MEDLTYILIDNMFATSKITFITTQENKLKKVCHSFQDILAINSQIQEISLWITGIFFFFSLKMRIRCCNQIYLKRISPSHQSQIHLYLDV